MSNQADQLHPMRHSLAHIMASAVVHLWPTAKLGVGPVVENGFYYDIDIPGTTISEEDFAAIESEMRKIISADQPFERLDKSISEAIAWAQKAQQPYKEELLNDLSRAGTTLAHEIDSEELGLVADGAAAVERVSFYQNGDFFDLCRGPHVASTGKVGAFKLMRIAGAYWRGKQTNPQMQRLYGVAFGDEAELQEYLHQIEEAKARDHRKLGKELDLFLFSDLVGSGLPLYTPRGTVVREGLIRLSEEVREKLGFQKVWSPHITKKELYETSGHWAKFGKDLFLVKSQETSDELVMKPMNCPHHTQIYASRQRSYRELPLKYMETTTNYRDEKTGELHGLSRVRSLSQDDSHTFCRQDQVAEIIGALIQAIQDFYKAVDMTLEVRLSLRDDSDEYLGDQQLWDFAQVQIEALAKDNQLDYYKEEGEAAFYGPKIDFMAIDAISRKWQVATVQFDFVQPERFQLTYTDEQGAEQRPIMIHCAIMGSFDRFFAVYIEHTAGKFPVWLAPEQLRIIQVKDSPEIDQFSDSVKKQAEEMALRAVVDRSNESVGKKIRATELAKVPYVVVVGEKEVQTGQVTPRLRKDIAVEGRAEQALSVERLLTSIANEARSRASRSSL